MGASIAVAMAIYGLPAVDLHPPLHRLGIMDPLCGGTRAARYAAQGRFEDAWTYNPLGIVAVYGALLADDVGADPADAFLLGLAHHLHNAVLPDAGFAGEILLGDHLEPVLERLTERELATLPRR